MSSVRLKVKTAFVEALKISDNAQESTLVYSEYPGWDSVAHMALVAVLESKFDCMMEMDDILELGSFQKALEIMAKYEK